MNYSSDNFNSRIINALQLPIERRCYEISTSIENCSIRELQDVYPFIVRSVFGSDNAGIGWGLRTTTEKKDGNLFAVLHQFFTVTGTMLQICHRLISDTIKFDFEIDRLPHNILAMLQSGQHSNFYGDIINGGSYQHHILSLSLNAFDFYMLHFVLHALQPLHRTHPAALQIHNERIKSVYYLLTAEYLNNFLPAHPDLEVLPANICPIGKWSQAVQIQAFQPIHKPRFLKIPSSYSAPTPDVSATPVGSHANVWRTETVLHFSIDVWIRFDIESEHDLPGSEFVRIVRLLIKQIHFFSNASLIDNTAMLSIRKIAMPMVKTHIYMFLRSLIDRWPLDNSMAVVVDLWLTYIQPWRYTLNYNANLDVLYEHRFHSRFDNFIADNLLLYTQFFWKFLQRLHRLDYCIYSNALILYRLARIFTQPDLRSKLEEVENNSTDNFGYDSPHKNLNYMRSHILPAYNESSPKMFSEEMRKGIENFIYMINVTRINLMHKIEMLNDEATRYQETQGHLKRFLKFLLNEVTTEEVTLKEISNIPEILKQATSLLSAMFGIDVSNTSVYDPNLLDSTDFQSVNFFDKSDCLDMSKITPYNMNLNESYIKHSVDPALLPVQSNELSVLVYLLHKISTKINITFDKKIQYYYSRNNVIGKIFRQFLYPPVTTQSFSKSQGYHTLIEEHIPARLCLRSLASFPVLIIIFISLIMGQLIWSTPVIGILVLFLIFLIYNLLMAILS